MIMAGFREGVNIETLENTTGKRSRINEETVDTWIDTDTGNRRKNRRIEGKRE